MAKTKLDLDDLKDAASATTAAPRSQATRKRTTSYLGDRNTSLSKMNQTEHKKFLKVDPARCRLWEKHDRFYDMLNEENCADLISGMKTEGRQQFPAIVRPVSDDPNYDWEVICGARRHWTISWLRANNYPNFEFLVEPRTLTDEEAFRLSDVENRDKQDLSDYERAVKYWKALNEYQYYKTQAEMAERMGLTRDKLVRFLRLAELPKEVAQAFSSIKEIKVDHARLLAPLLNNPKQKKNIIAEAESIASEQQGRAEADQEPLEAAVVFKRLKLAAEAKAAAKPNATAEDIKGSNGKILFNVKKGRAGQLDMKINMKNAASREELETAFQEMLSRYWQNV